LLNEIGFEYLATVKVGYKRADLPVDIAGLGVIDAARRARREVEAFARSVGKPQA
jgi:hypothetical protein